MKKKAVCVISSAGYLDHCRFIVAGLAFGQSQNSPPTRFKSKNYASGLFTKALPQCPPKTDRILSIYIYYILILCHFQSRASLCQSFSTSWRTWLLPYFSLQSSASPGQPHFIEELSQLHSFLFHYLRHSTVDTSITNGQVEARNFALKLPCPLTNCVV